jgi:hypothetical protein
LCYKNCSWVLPSLIFSCFLPHPGPTASPPPLDRHQLQLCTGLLRALAGPKRSNMTLGQVHMIVEKMRALLGGEGRAGLLAAEPRAGPADVAAFCEALTAALDVLPTCEPFQLGPRAPTGNSIRASEARGRWHHRPSPIPEFYHLADVSAKEYLLYKGAQSFSSAVVYSSKKGLRRSRQYHCLFIPLLPHALLLPPSPADSS